MPFAPSRGLFRGENGENGVFFKKSGRMFWRNGKVAVSLHPQTGRASPPWGCPDVLPPLRVSSRVRAMFFDMIP